MGLYQTQELSGEASHEVQVAAVVWKEWGIPKLLVLMVYSQGEEEQIGFLKVFFFCFFTTRT